MQASRLTHLLFLTAASATVVLGPSSSASSDGAPGAAELALLRVQDRAHLELFQAPAPAAGAIWHLDRELEAPGPAVGWTDEGHVFRCTTLDNFPVPRATALALAGLDPAATALAEAGRVEVGAAFALVETVHAARVFVVNWRAYDRDGVAGDREVAFEVLHALSAERSAELVAAVDAIGVEAFRALTRPEPADRAAAQRHLELLRVFGPAGAGRDDRAQFAAAGAPGASGVFGATSAATGTTVHKKWGYWKCVAFNLKCELYTAGCLAAAPVAAAGCAAACAGTLGMGCVACVIAGIAGTVSMCEAALNCWQTAIDQGCA